METPFTSASKLLIQTGIYSMRWTNWSLIHRSWIQAVIVHDYFEWANARPFLEILIGLVNTADIKE